MSDQIILQLITTVLAFCSADQEPRKCFKELWFCGHAVSTPSVIVSETHNCITTYVKKTK